MMLISRLGYRGATASLCSIRTICCTRSRVVLQIRRCKSTFPPTPKHKATSARTAYPESLLIYHAGTGKTVFIGCLKVTTVFIFSFFCLVVAPAHWLAEAEPPWVAVGVILSGLVPVLFVSYIYAPFVNYIHLRVPPYVRYSRDLLMRYSKTPPNDAVLEITTMNFIGKPRATRVKVADLYPVRERFGLANYARDTELLNSKRPWWMGKAVRQFGIHGGSGRTREGGVWDSISRAISKRSV